METNEMKRKPKLTKVIGIIFLIPPLIGVLAFLLAIFDNNLFTDIEDYVAWSGDADYNWSNSMGGGGGGGYSSMLPVYLGLMALSGAYLIKE